MGVLSKSLTLIKKGSIISIMNLRNISTMQKHLPLNSGWTVSRPEFTSAIGYDTGGFGK